MQTGPAEVSKVVENGLSLAPVIIFTSITTDQRGHYFVHSYDVLQVFLAGECQRLRTFFNVNAVIRRL